jgi:hypothetical protein
MAEGNKSLYNTKQYCCENIVNISNFQRKKKILKDYTWKIVLEFPSLEKEFKGLFHKIYFS